MWVCTTEEIQCELAVKTFVLQWLPKLRAALTGRDEWCHSSPSPQTPAGLPAETAPRTDVLWEYLPTTRCKMFPWRARVEEATWSEDLLKETQLLSLLSAHGNLGPLLWIWSSSHPSSFVSRRAGQRRKNQNDAKYSWGRSSFEVRAFRLLQMVRQKGGGGIRMVTRSYLNSKLLYEARTLSWTLIGLKSK